LVPARVAKGPRSTADVVRYQMIPSDTIVAMAMTLRLNDDLSARLRETAAREHKSMHEIAVAAIEEYTNRRNQRRDELLREFTSSRRELLARLRDNT
jgi:predicted esterase